MESPLDNPFEELVDTSGKGPAKAWKLAGLGAGMAGATAARMLLEAGRRQFSDQGDVPLNPADRRMGWPKAIGWAALIAVAGAFGRLLMQRALAAVWQRRTKRPVEAMPSA